MHSHGLAEGAQYAGTTKAAGSISVVHCALGSLRGLTFRVDERPPAMPGDDHLALA
jgi:hypothetical protein